MTEFEIGFIVGNRLQKRALPMILALRTGVQGTSKEFGERFGMTTDHASGFLRALYDLHVIHICAWSDRFAVYGWGDKKDVDRPFTPRKKRLTVRESIEAAVEREAKRLADTRERIEAFNAETTEIQTEEAELFKRTQHGKETQNGHVRIHRME